MLCTEPVGEEGLRGGHWPADEERSRGEWGLEEGALMVWKPKSLEGFGLGLAMLGLGWSVRDEIDCLGEMLSPAKETRVLLNSLHFMVCKQY